MHKAILFSREVISHERCGDKCDINQADPTCDGQVVATLVLKEEANGLFVARMVSGFLSLVMGVSHSDEKCLEKAAEYLGSQGLWIGGAHMWKIGDKIEVVYHRERKDGINTRAVLWATITSVTNRRAEWKTDEIHMAEKFFRAQDIPMEGGFSTNPSVHLDYIRRRI